MSLPLVPLTKEHLQVLKAVTDDKLRLEKIHQCVQTLYTAAVQFAKTSTDTMFKYNMKSFGTNKAFVITHMADILAVLQELFPDSSVSHAILAKGIDGRFYDISKLDDNTRALVNRAPDDSYIVIDWS